MTFSALLRIYNGCVLRGMLRVRVGDVIARVHSTSEIIKKFSLKLAGAATSFTLHTQIVHQIVGKAVLVAEVRPLKKMDLGFWLQVV